jgi:hypothetical protein
VKDIMFGSISLGNRSVYNSATNKIWQLGKMTRMTNDDLSLWRAEIRDTIDDAVQNGLQREVRGLFIGISAVFYAAQA